MAIIEEIGEAVEEIKEIMESSEPRELKIVALEGPHGVGKTTITLQFEDDPRVLVVRENFLECLNDGPIQHFKEEDSDLKEVMLARTEKRYSRDWFVRLRAAIDEARLPGSLVELILIDRTVYTQLAYPRGTNPEFDISVLIMNNLLMAGGDKSKIPPSMQHPRFRVYDWMGVPAMLLNICPTTVEGVDIVWQRILARMTAERKGLMEADRGHLDRIVAHYGRMDVGNKVSDSETALIIIKGILEPKK